MKVSPPPLLDHFYRFLETERGMRPATIYLYRHFSNQLLIHLQSDGSAASLARLKIVEVDAFVLAAGRTYSRKSMAVIGSVMRALLLHLFREGVPRHDLSRCRKGLRPDALPLIEGAMSNPSRDGRPPAK